MNRYFRAFSNVLELYIDAPHKTQKRVVRAWSHCRQKGMINGCKAPKEVRQCISDLFLAIRAEPDPELRAEWRKDVTRALKDRACKKLRRALE